MDLFDRVWDALGPIEGGYSFDPADPGGETMWGITARIARAGGYTGPMKDLPHTTAGIIARRTYWTPILGDEISAIDPEIAAELFDIDFNQGPHGAGWLQQALNALNYEALWPELIEDQLIGAATVQALASFVKARGRPGVSAMLKVLGSLRCVEYLKDARSRPTSRKFLFGWVVNRVRMDGPVLAA